MLKVGIVGAAGYAGAELVRIVLRHPEFDLRVITSNSDEGATLASVYPAFSGATNLVFSRHDNPELFNCDVVFLATPHTVAMKSAPGLLDSGVTVVDLSADYRLRSQETYEKWYKVQHTSPDLLATAAFGQPELNREELNAAAERHANGESVLVACAGCYLPLPFPKASWLPMQSRVFPALAAALRHALILFPLTKTWRLMALPAIAILLKSSRFWASRVAWCSRLIWPLQPVVSFPR